ncbi:hypothetical protein GCM10011608_42440 [Micromonospora sonchi]|uniref:Uncharacterized protein n=1 Tax=Micromonospora sonchi TaxID=1763543 RepID=A0A917U2B3_9ACTN|nr:hypothetical protein [Micromonospora sonchi]GGM53082.1 hypothetical protein GCM10011608_42440 [Micromonospora sonchi]
MTDEPITATLERVRAFLERFYHAEASDDRAASAALQASLGDDPQERWRNAQAFGRAIDAELPAGELQQLVFRASGRNVLTDDEAREFLERVYDDNAFDVAIDYDED